MRKKPGEEWWLLKKRGTTGAKAEAGLIKEMVWSQRGCTERVRLER